MATLESIETLLKEFKKNTENHFKVLNGSVAKNTSFRNKAIGGFIVVGFLGVTIIVKLFV